VGLLLPGRGSARNVECKLVEVILRHRLGCMVDVYVHVHSELVDISEGVLISVVGVGRGIACWKEKARLNRSACEVLASSEASVMGGVVFVGDEGVRIGKVACVESVGCFIEFAEDFAAAAGRFVSTVEMLR